MDRKFENLATASTTDHIRVATPAGPLEAYVIHPRRITHAKPLVVLHGISRNAQTLVRYFRDEAERNGRLIIVPHFTEKDWPHFQRPGPAARADQALVELLNRLALQFPACAGPVDLFGHSGGAQLAHRTAMLYPQRIARLNLAAAGWYCLPNMSMPFPYGLGKSDARGAELWTRRKQAGLAAYLGLEIRVFIGTRDTERDCALRVTPALDAGQGRTRHDRARSYVEAVRKAARSNGYTARISLIELPDCSHDVEQAIITAGLARMVADIPDTSISLAAAG
ncbi:alpha/beta fold hydrolase [Paracoccus saliphilus]|uniref:Alpha/beta hydrolase n=1 Tax=Paracoccus saliphilus TaxID=405559 RepID=A0AA46A449_9RHOB|nr:alpha/beta hydrolase [Paracoccus saliphilus]WCR03541.1 alpha/beta hydrolase [Paracoccus saliphilus]SIS55425.1 Pimeloyl-ACP methyl ester carboxylesterase [Paracoccus saliphilus]